MDKINERYMDVKAQSKGFLEGDVPAIVHDYDMARMERLLHKCLRVITVMALVICGLVAALVYSAYDYVDVTVDSQDGGNASYIGASGIINNGKGDSQEANQEE